MSILAYPTAILVGLLTSTIPLTAQRAPMTPATGLSPDTLALACGPAGTTAQPATPLRITGGQDGATPRN